MFRGVVATMPYYPVQIAKAWVCLLNPTSKYKSIADFINRLSIHTSAEWVLSMKMMPRGHAVPLVAITQKKQHILCS